MANPIQDSDGRFIADDEATAAVFRAQGLPFVMAESQPVEQPVALPKARPYAQQVEDVRIPFFDAETIGPLFAELGRSRVPYVRDRANGRRSMAEGDYRDARGALNSLGVPLEAISAFEAAHAKAARRGEPCAWTYQAWRSRENQARADADPSGRTPKGRSAIQDNAFDCLR